MSSAKKHINMLFASTCVGVLIYASSSSISHANTLSNAQLKGLASSFLTRIGPSFEAEKSTTKQDALDRILSQIPDGEILILRPLAGELLYDLDIMAIKQKEGIFLSFYDFISVFEFPITYDSESHDAFGWFLREDWNFSLNYDEKQVISKEKVIPISEQDIYMDGTELYVKESAMEEWFNMAYDVDLSQQYIKIYSDYPLPQVAQYSRQKREEQKARNARFARLPRKDVKYDNFDINLADLTLRSAISMPGDGDLTKRNSASLALEGETLQHSAYLLANTDNQEGLNTVIARIKKESDEPDLLGPLKARSYTIGDANTAEIPLTGFTGQELGVNISNNPLQNSDFETTQIEGDALPGWDVELYRNGGLVSSVTVDNTGRYLFENIQLFGGDNTFELFFYGPQGEIRTDNVNIPVSQALLSTQDKTYEFSASLSDKRTYRSQEEDDPDYGTAHISGRYNFFLGDALSYAGFRSRQVNDENKMFLAAGVTKIIGPTIVDVNTAVDNDGEAAAEIIGRAEILGWDTALSNEFRTDEFTTDESTDPQVINTSLNLNRKIIPPVGDRANIAARFSHIETASGTTTDQQRLNYSHNFGRLNISNTFLNEQRTGLDDRMSDTLAMRYNYGKYLLRGGVTYDIKPDSEVDRYFSQINYRPTSKLNADLSIDHQPFLDLTEGRLNVSYIHDKVRISPYLSVDTDNDVIAGLNLNSSLIHDDRYDAPIITSDRLIGKGLVSTFVFHDKDGDMVFNNDDEALPEVIVESVNVKRRETTDEQGRALIKNLPEATVTDIQIDASTLPDPYMIPAFDGNSIFPRGGDIINMDFPVHLAGEIDGTVTVKNQDESYDRVRLMEIQLIPMSGNKEIKTAKTAGDGFFVFSQVPPGDYLLTPSYEDLKARELGQPTPQRVSIGYDGTVLYGQNIELSKSIPPTPFKSNANGSGTYVLNIGKQGVSKLSSLIGKLMTRRTATPLMRDLTPVDGDAGQKRYTTPTGTLKESFERCQMLIQNNTPCEIEQAMLSQK